MDAKFTPGPWVANCFMVVAPPYVGMYGGTEVCHTGIVGNRNTEECAANAQLIAAAPDLYEALRDAQTALAMLLDANTTTQHAYAHVKLAEAKARAALAKAAAS